MVVVLAFGAARFEGTFDAGTTACGLGSVLGFDPKVELVPVFALEIEPVTKVVLKPDPTELTVVELMIFECGEGLVVDRRGLEHE